MLVHKIMLCSMLINQGKMFMSSTTKRCEVGQIYQHYKGGYYKIIALARDADSLESLVVYTSLSNKPHFPKDSNWVRSENDFTQEVIIDGKQHPRFRLRSDNHADFEKNS